MKKAFSLVPAFLAGLFLLTSCHSRVENEMENPAVPVMFNLNPIGLDGIFPMASETRAITTQPVRMLVLDVMDNKVVSENTVNQAVETPLEKLTMTLSYGTHTLYFLLSARDFDSFDENNLTVSWGTNRLSYVWALKKEIEVTGEDIADQTINLDLVIGQFRLVCNDAFPNNIGNVQISSPALCWKLDLKTMAGVPGTVSYNLDASSLKGQTGKTISTYTFIPSDEKISEITFTAYTNDEDSPEVIKQHTISNIDVKKGYITQYSGNFFSSNASFSPSWQQEWTGTTYQTY